MLNLISYPNFYPVDQYRTWKFLFLKEWSKCIYPILKIRNGNIYYLDINNTENKNIKYVKEFIEAYNTFFPDFQVDINSLSLMGEWIKQINGL
ncbi:MAG: hypothetical protein IPL55_00185 [Saprospiraceae bacterium]|nr:hypothetical protein [Saprospiraceae bacterium]